MKRKILSIFLCSLMLAGGVCGCGHDDDSNINSDSEPKSDSAEISVETTENITEGFDWEKVKQDITFEGKKLISRFV